MHTEYYLVILLVYLVEIRAKSSVDITANYALVPNMILKVVKDIILLELGTETF